MRLVDSGRGDDASEQPNIYRYDCNRRPILRREGDETVPWPRAQPSHFRETRDEGELNRVKSFCWPGNCPLGSKFRRCGGETGEGEI